jgi:hypothetical protein
MDWIIERYPEFNTLVTFIIAFLDTPREGEKEVVAKLLRKNVTDREDLAIVLKQLNDFMDSPLPVEEKMALLSDANLYCPDWPSTLEWLRKMEQLLEETIQELG